ncbi:MAG: hypothetical protein GY834_12135 [Bacteroidetes bacterium]|nr:hypothetical protein [Bacteroidota bacterium]
MNQKYSFYSRYQNINWSFIHIETLLRFAKRKNNPSFAIYAALESRNIIERIEFELIVMSANSKFGIKDFENIKDKHGIQKANKEFNTLKFRYQTFTESFSKAVKPDLNLRVYNFKKAEKIKGNLSQYLHTYSRSDNELEFESLFIQEGFDVIQSAVDFLKDYFPKDDKGYYLCVLDFMTLVEPMKKEFKIWLNSSEQDNENLTERLINIAKN